MRFLTTMVLAMGAVALLAMDGRAGEKIKLDQLPKGVVDAVKTLFPKAELKGAEKAKDGDHIVFEVMIKDGESSIELNVTDAGVVTAYEKIIEAKDLPKAVAETIAAKYPNKKPKLLEEFYTVKDGKGTFAYYEAIFEIDGKDVEVEVLADGKLKPAEKK